MILIGTAENACCSPASMRRVHLLGSFIALLAALLALWAYRFERSPGLPVWTLADLKAATPQIPGVEWTGPADQPNALRLKVDASNPRVAARIVIPGIPVVEMLHLRFQMSARGLIRGREEWADGRFIVEWHSPDGGPGWENDQVGAVDDDDQGELMEFVVHPRQTSAIPILRLEHLGRSGEFEIADLKITVIEERMLWKIGRWFLACGWLAWGAVFVRSWRGISWWRAVGASAIWVLMGINFVIPGPWKIQRALYPEFQIGMPPVGAIGPDSAPAAIGAGDAPHGIHSGPALAMGGIPAQGSLALRLKLRIKKARPFFHALMLFAPALVIACLVGRRPALLLVVTLALAIELAQVGFGYGFGWDDVFDLITDALGIVGAMWAYQKVSKRLGRWCVESGIKHSGGRKAA